MVKKTKRPIQWIKKLNKQKYTGIHLIAEFWYGKIIENEKEIKKILNEAVKESNTTPLKTIIHKFSPQGLTGVVLLEESHIAIHTWPEINYTAIDIFTCGEKSMPDKALDSFKKAFEPREIKIKKIKRGEIHS